MSKLIDHYSVVATRAEMTRDAQGHLKRLLVIDTDLVLLPGAPYHSDRAVAELVDIVAAYQVRHDIAEIILREVHP